MEEMYLGKRDAVDSQSAHIGQFTISGTTITKTSGDGSWHQVLMVPMIDGARTFTFTLRILKTTNRNIMTGIVATKCRGQQHSHNTEYAAAYSANGWKYPGNI